MSNHYVVHFSYVQFCQLHLNTAAGKKKMDYTDHLYIQRTWDGEAGERQKKAGSFKGILKVQMRE